MRRTIDCLLTLRRAIDRLLATRDMSMAKVIRAPRLICQSA